MLASKHQPGCPDQDQQDGREGSESRKKTVLQKTMSQSKADLQAEKGKQHGKEACQPGRELHDTGTEAGGGGIQFTDRMTARIRISRNPGDRATAGVSSSEMTL